MIGDSGRSSLDPDRSGGVTRSLWTVKFVEMVDAVSALKLSVGAVFAIRFLRRAPCGCSALWPDSLLLPEEEWLRSSTTSFAGLPLRDSLGTVGGSVLNNKAYSSSINLASFLQPFQQSRQSQTRNLKQKTSIFMQGWKHIHKLRKSILFLSEWASRRLRWQVIANKR